MVYRLPPLAALRAFESAARHGSFKLASEELHVTPAAVSQQIKALEDYLAQPLFERLPRNVRLLPAGEVMLPRLREGFECLAAAVEATRLQSRQQRLNVNAPPAFASRWLMPRLGGFATACPEIDLRISSSEENIDQPDSLATQSVDPRADVSEIIIRYGNGDYPGHKVSRIFNPVLVAACSPELLSGEHPLQTPEDLRWHVLIHDDTMPESDYPNWADWMRAAGVESIETRKGPRFSNALALEAAMDGLGVVLALKPLIADAVTKGRLVIPFDVIVPSRHGYYLVVAEAMAERPAVRAFSAWLLEQAGKEK